MVLLAALAFGIETTLDIGTTRVAIKIAASRCAVLFRQCVLGSKFLNSAIKLFLFSDMGRASMTYSQAVELRWGKRAEISPRIPI